MSQKKIDEIVRAYDSTIVRLYCHLRFKILHQRFLNELGQYLPPSGRILDVGCGFGLFSLYFSALQPNRRILGLDLNTHRIATATRVAQKLGLDGVQYQIGNASTIEIKEDLDAAYMLDLIHHIPPDAVPNLLAAVKNKLRPGGILLIKDVAAEPRYKRYFTWALDKAMDWRTPVHYWHIADLRALMVELGFSVRVHEMIDFLPYPHVLYVCTLA